MFVFDLRFREISAPPCGVDGRLTILRIRTVNRASCRIRAFAFCSAELQLGVLANFKTIDAELQLGATIPASARMPNIDYCRRLNH